MANNGNHMISRFMWDTSFDEKGRGGEMQERLSNWSRISMPGEITAVFDDVCPPEQTWRIQSLEIDLGLIAYSNMEFELGIKLRQQLSEKLLEMIFYSNRSGSNVEILNEDTSHLYIISSFLLNGLMPWSYKPTDGSVNQMLAYQLQHNRDKTIGIIREVGITHENVRKRIAWQVSESNIIKIIEGLEPNNHAQVIDFSNELVKIQAKESIVQTSTKDLKKQLWLWILNYLLTERGTVFNKVAYMRSTIGQMADHYNIGYHELLDLIERAVVIIRKVYGIKSDFLLTLSMLTKEYKDQQQNLSHQHAETPEDLWITLTAYFKNGGKQLLKARKAEFNELVTGLYRQDAVRFKELILSLGYHKILWICAVRYLSNTSLEVIFSALAGSATTGLLDIIYFLNNANRKLNKRWDRTTLWNIGLQYLYSHQGASVSGKHFLSYWITTLGELSQLPKQQLVDELMGVRIAAKYKTAATLTVTDNLATIFTAEVTGTSSVISVESISELISALTAQVRQGITNKKLFISQQKRLERYIQLSPKSVLQALMTFGKHSEIQLIIPYILNSYTTTALFKEAQSISPFFDLIRLLKLEAKVLFKQSEAITNTINNVLMPLALRIFILHPSLAATKLIEVLFNDFYEVITNTQVLQFQQLVDSMIITKKLPDFSVCSTRTAFIKTTVTGSILHLVSAASNNQAAVGKLLTTNFTHAEIVKLRNNRSKESIQILNYLVPRGHILMELLIKRCTTMLSDEIPGYTQSKIRFRLTELFWKSIAAYVNHRGNWDSLKKVFHKAVVFNFPIPLKVEAGSFNPSSENHLPQGRALMDQLVKAYAAVLIRELHGISETDIIAQLIMLYKAAIADTHAHGGISAKLVSLFKKRVTAAYPILDVTLLDSIIIDGQKYASNISTSDRQIINNLYKPLAPVASGIMYQLKSGFSLSADEIFTLVREVFISEKQDLIIDIKKINFKELVKQLLESDPRLLRQIITHTPVSQKRIALLQSVVSFNKFSLWIASNAGTTVAEGIESLRVLYHLLNFINGVTIPNSISCLFWQQAWQLLSTGSLPDTELKHLVENSLRQITTQPRLNAGLISAVIARNNLRLTPALEQALGACFPGFTAIQQSNNYTINQPVARLVVAAQWGLLEELCYSFVLQKQIPAWFTDSEQSAGELLNEIVIHYPVNVLSVIKQHVIPEQQLVWLSETIDFKLLIATIGHLNKTRQANLAVVEQFYYALSHATIRGISAQELQFILFKKVIKTLSSGNWRLLSVECIWNELLWEVCTKKGLSKTGFIKDADKTISYFPPALQISFGYLKEQYHQSAIIPDKLSLIKPIKTVIQNDIKQSPLKIGVTVKNAGMVLVSTYVPMLFERLGLTINKKFKDIDAQCLAVHYLQYVVTGLTHTDEALLPLNKMMCGLDLAQPIADGIDITPEQVTLIEGLIKAVIGYWPAIGNTSINGFRGNWLVRDGLLSEQEDRWELTVEKRAYDILIHRSPFSFSIIKHPWMSKPLHVTWPY